MHVTLAELLEFTCRSLNTGIITVARLHMFAEFPACLQTSEWLDGASELMSAAFALHSEAMTIVLYTCRWSTLVQTNTTSGCSEAFAHASVNFGKHHTVVSAHQ